MAWCAGWRRRVWLRDTYLHHHISMPGMGMWGNWRVSLGKIVLRNTGLCCLQRRACLSVGVLSSREPIPDCPVRGLDTLARYCGQVKGTWGSQQQMCGGHSQYAHADQSLAACL